MENLTADRSYVVMDRLPGATLNELTYRRPEILEEHKVTIAYQLGMHMAFAYVFGAKDGFQTNYIFDTVSKILTRIDKESFFDMPVDPDVSFEDNDEYTQEIAACELSNLKYIPSFRKAETRPQVIIAFRQGFIDKYQDIKDMRGRLLEMTLNARKTWKGFRQIEDMIEYDQDTDRIHAKVAKLIDQDPDKVFDRLLKAKAEVDTGRYAKK